MKLLMFLKVKVNLWLLRLRLRFTEHTAEEHERSSLEARRMAENFDYESRDYTRRANNARLYARHLRAEIDRLKSR